MIIIFLLFLVILQVYNIFFYNLLIVSALLELPLLLGVSCVLLLRQHLDELSSLVQVSQLLIQIGLHRVKNLLEGLCLRFIILLLLREPLLIRVGVVCSEHFVHLLRSELLLASGGLSVAQLVLCCSLLVLDDQLELVLELNILQELYQKSHLSVSQLCDVQLDLPLIAVLLSLLHIELFVQLLKLI